MQDGDVVTVTIWSRDSHKPLFEVRKSRTSGQLRSRRLVQIAEFRLKEKQFEVERSVLIHEQGCFDGSANWFR